MYDLASTITVKTTLRARNTLAIFREETGPVDGRTGRSWWLSWRNDTHLVGLMAEAQVQQMVAGYARDGQFITGASEVEAPTVAEVKAVPALAELNASPRRREWAGLILERRYAVARGGMKAGDKVHLLATEVVIEDTLPVAQRGRNRVKVGQIHSAKRDCNSNGQVTGRPVEGWDTDRITCASCLRGLTHRH